MKFKKRTNGIYKINKQGSKKRRRTGRRMIAIMRKTISNNRKGISKYDADEGKKQ
jgi:hypothetical protein